MVVARLASPFTEMQAKAYTSLLQHEAELLRRTPQPA
jgi:hypothetical protein